MALCDFEPTSEVHPNSGPVWRCIHKGCGRKCYGTRPKTAVCKSMRMPYAIAWYWPEYRRPAAGLVRRKAACTPCAERARLAAERGDAT